MSIDVMTFKCPSCGLRWGLKIDVEILRRCRNVEAHRRPVDVDLFPLDHKDEQPLHTANGPSSAMFGSVRLLPSDPTPTPEVPPPPQESYAETAKAIGQLLTEKNKAYGDSFEKSGEIMKVLYPDGISPEQMVDALCVVRILDKLFRIATNKDAFGESPYGDIAGYAILGKCHHS